MTSEFVEWIDISHEDNTDQDSSLSAGETIRGVRGKRDRIALPSCRENVNRFLLTPASDAVAFGVGTTLYKCAALFGGPVSEIGRDVHRAPNAFAFGRVDADNADALSKAWRSFALIVSPPNSGTVVSIEGSAAVEKGGGALRSMSIPYGMCYSFSWRSRRQCAIHEKSL